MASKNFKPVWLIAALLALVIPVLVIAFSQPADHETADSPAEDPAGTAVDVSVKTAAATISPPASKDTFAESDEDDADLLAPDILEDGSVGSFSEAEAADDGTDADTAADTAGNNQPWYRPADEPAALRKGLDDAVSIRWIYQDVEQCGQEALRSGKPLLAVFKCVPCGAAPNVDEPLTAADSPLADLLDKFVCVRVVQLNGINRNVFRFDRDVPYVAMFLNGDGTVYGRYGTRISRARDRMPRHTLPSFRKSLERALELHSGYPQNKASLAGKQAAASEPVMPEDMADMKPFPFNPPEVKNCIHCHMVGEANTAEILRESKLTPRDLAPFPLPDNIGLRLDTEDGLLVRSITADSAAAAAGVRPGDELLSLEDQPLTSEADVAWVLHHLEDDARPELKLRRGGNAISVTLALSGTWRRGAVDFRASLTPARPNVHLRRDSFRSDRVQPGDMATVYYPRDEAAKAGLRQGDVMIAVDGRTDLTTEADFLHYLHLQRPEAKSVEVTVLRKTGQELKLSLPVR